MNSQSARVLLGISGGIAAYKVCEVASTLAKAGYEVRAILTEAARQFVSPLTFSTLCRHPAYTDQDFWHPQQGRPLHIELGEWADVLLLAPLTANTLGKLAHGLADNLLTNTVLASTCPILLAPAMNTDMWEQRVVQANWAQLLTDSRYHTIEPGSGLLACDRIGTGRMAEPQSLLAYLRSLTLTQGQRDLHNRHLLINTGGTREFLDPVRFIGNPATGKMGLALAQAALHRGAQVTLVHGPMDSALLAQLTGKIQITGVTSAAEMHGAMLSALPNADWIILTAAVADVRPKHQATIKLPKQDLPQQLDLEFAVDIAADLAVQKQPHQKLVGFAAQTGDIITPASQKLHKKGLDAIIANPIDQPQSGFGQDWNQATFIDSSGNQQELGHCPKWQLAHRILDMLSD